MTVRLLMKYVANKLRLDSESEVFNLNPRCCFFSFHICVNNLSRKSSSVAKHQCYCIPYSAYKLSRGHVEDENVKN